MTELSDVRLVVFDFDGLILDTERPEFEAWRHVFEHHGVEPLTVEELARHANMSPRHFTRRFQSEPGRTSIVVTRRPDFVAAGCLIAHSLDEALQFARERGESEAFVIGGAEDEISSPEVMGAMAEKIPDSRHVVLEGAGHLSNLETPTEFDAALKDFLKEV